MAQKLPNGNDGLDDHRVIRFANEVGPRIRDYVRQTYPDTPVTIVPIGSGGFYFGQRLRAYLVGQRIETREVATEADNILTTLREHRRELRGTLVIGVDDAIYTSKTYEEKWKPAVGKLKGELGFLDVKYAVDHDPLGKADWSSSPEKRRRVLGIL